MAGSRSFVAIAEWAAAATPHALDKLGIPGRGASESTIRRTPQRLDADRLDVILGAWAALHHDVDPEQMQVIALDGITLRGARGPDGRRRHLLAALTHDTTIVLGQRDVDGKTNEIPCCQSFSIPLTSSGTDHRRCPAHPDRPCRLPRDRTRRALFADRETEPADPAHPTGVAAQGRRSDHRHPE